MSEPQRWLEGDGAEVTSFVAGQNELSRAYLAELPERTRFVEILTDLLHSPSAGCPWTCGGWLFCWMDDGDNQPRLVRCRSVEELADAEIVLDPNLLSSDATTAVLHASVNDDASLLAYTISSAGSDWQTIRIRDLATLEELDHEIRWSKWTPPTWLPDGRTFSFTAFPEPEGNALTEVSSQGVLTAFNVDTGRTTTLWAAQEPGLIGRHFAADEWLIISARESTSSNSLIWARRFDQEELTLIGRSSERLEPVALREDTLMCLSFADAPRGKIIAIKLPSGEQQELLAEHPEDVLVDFRPTVAGYIAHYLSDAQAKLVAFDLDGVLREELPIGRGSGVSDLKTRHDSAQLFVATSGFLDNGQRIEAQVSGHRVLDWRIFADPTSGTRGSTSRVRFPSSDGTLVPAFLIEPPEAPKDARPTLIWGYGGFNIAQVPQFRPMLAAWVAAGGTLVVANLRGGGEFGTQWHDAGTRLHKQQVFDDLYSIASGLIAQGIATRSQLGLHGRSNGGLLAGAALTQRPDLWAAVVPAVGVLDMLRFHKFTVGWAWRRDYGDPEDPESAEYLRSYSPLHNITRRVYPPTLITTGYHDDRVVPAHSFKFAAELQRLGQGGPFYLLVDDRAGHGIGKPKSALLEEYVSQLAFLAHHTGLKPKAAKLLSSLG